jgi:hypothetical protein
MLSRKDVAAQQVKVVLSLRERNHLAERDVYDDRLASAKRFCRRWFRRGAPSLTLLAKPGAEFPNFRKRGFQEGGGREHEHSSTRFWQ